MAMDNRLVPGAAPKSACRIGALGDAVVRRTLPRYVGIVEGKRYPRFRIAKRVPCGIRLSSPLDGLWAEHGRLLREFRGLSGRVDRGMSLGEPAGVSFLDLKLEIAKRLLAACCFCERRCKVDRQQGERGECGVGKHARVASVSGQAGEPCVSPSLAVFFAGCNFHCAFCRDWEISQLQEGSEEASGADIAGRIAAVPDVASVCFAGGEPTPDIHAVIEALSLVERDLPVVWSSNMYMSGEAMALLDGVVDLFVSDFKYGRGDSALRYSGVKDYFQVVARNQALACACAEMVIKVPFLPGGWVRTDLPDILGWISDNCRERVLVRLVHKYRPEYKAKAFPGLSGTVSMREFEEGKKMLEARGLRVFP